MGIDAQLRRETGEIIVAIDDHAMALSRATGGALAATRLLKYLVPWGDAIFNQAQAEDLRFDIRDVIAANPGSPLSAHLAEVEALVDKLASETHVYLWFVGD